MSKRSGFPGTRIAPISLTGAPALLAERAAAGPDRAGAGCSCFFWPAFWPERTLIVRAKADTNSNTIRPAKFDFIATPASQLALQGQGEQLCLKNAFQPPTCFSVLRSIIKVSKQCNTLPDLAIACVSNHAG